MENIDDLIQKFQNRCISDEELMLLEQWVKSSKRNTYYFKNAVEQDYLLTAYSRKDERSPDFESYRPRAFFSILAFASLTANSLA